MCDHTAAQGNTHEAGGARSEAAREEHGTAETGLHLLYKDKNSRIWQIPLAKGGKKSTGESCLRD